ncbi:zinc finger protein 521-like isoform X1 [Hypomesus transpacificus]|uniref:zinc finger protein 521-like isoform X1 n=1 Tax=Hypomesus transpacificus TaxID=137520 RepID=UPI001F07F4F5|nr:zinc finger protein 521-like isoform X1 [Hypomesus transpacificus]
MSRRKQAKPRSLKAEDNVTEDQHSSGPTAIPSDSECALERATEDGEPRRLRKRLLSPEEGEEGEEEDDEPALHSCDSCRQVFESLSDLTEHKINQCQLTGKQRSAHLSAFPPSALPLSAPLCSVLPVSPRPLCQTHLALCGVQRTKGPAILHDQAPRSVPSVEWTHTNIHKYMLGKCVLR